VGSSSHGDHSLVIFFSLPPPQLQPEVRTKNSSPLVAPLHVPKLPGPSQTSANVLIKGLHGQDRWPKASAANDTSFCGWPANLLSTVMFFVGTVTLIVNGFHTVLDNCSSDVPETTRTCFVGTLKYSCEVYK
jgi:hypothetical protein